MGSEIDRLFRMAGRLGVLWLDVKSEGLHSVSLSFPLRRSMEVENRRDRRNRRETGKGITT